MTKNCPECGKQLPDDAKFCVDCGHAFEGEKTSQNSVPFNMNRLFLILIIAVVIVGAVFILTFDGGDSNSSKDDADNAEHVDLTITGVGGWDSDSSSKKSYTLYTEALFTSVPGDMKGYLVKTSYYDDNDTQIGQETEKLEQIYYDSDYGLSFGHYTTYTLPDPDHVVVQIIKDGKVIDNYTEVIDTNKIDYLN